MAERVMLVDKAQPRHSTGAWWRMLALGLVFFAGGIALLLLTGNPNLFPTVVLIGNLTVPAAYVAFFYERKQLSRLTMPTTALGFVYGGLLGVFAASLLEPLLVPGLSPQGLLLVGLIEEFVKLLGVFVLMRRQSHESELDGLILGAAAGMGFAALESLGYAFTAFLRSGGSLSATVSVTLLRGLLAPVGHGVWTAILVGVLFRESRGTHFRFNRKVLGAYLTVATLHTLWDALPLMAAAFFPQGVDLLLAQALVGGVGLAILTRRWREAVARQKRERETEELQFLLGEQDNPALAALEAPFKVEHAKHEEESLPV